MSYLVIDKMVPLNAPNYVLHCLQKTQDGAAAMPVVLHKPMGGILWIKSG